MSNVRMNEFSKKMREWTNAYIREVTSKNGSHGPEVEVEKLAKHLLTRMKANKVAMVPDISDWTRYVGTVLERTLKEGEFESRVRIVRPIGSTNPKQKGPAGRSGLRMGSYKGPRRAGGVRW